VTQLAEQNLKAFGLRGPTDYTRELTVRLHTGDTDRPECTRLPHTEYGTGFYYSPEHDLSVAVLPDTGHEYEYGCSTVARQNARHAAKLGYRHTLIDRHEWEDDLHAIRSSQRVRQGREMPAAYLEWQPYSPDGILDDHCPRHLVAVHGIVKDGRLVAYAQMVQCGEIVRFNSILGHWDHLPNRVVWLMVMELVKWHIDHCGAGFALYYTHLSGHGPGLRYFKERLGFRPARVTWQP
jgi:hypothetical protein